MTDHTPPTDEPAPEDGVTYPLIDNWREVNAEQARKTPLTDEELEESFRQHQALREEQMRSNNPAVVLEIVMQCHLPMKLLDDSVMCLCHGQPNDAIFDGPVFHRQHVARLQVEKLRAAGHMP